MTTKIRPVTPPPYKRQTKRAPAKEDVEKAVELLADEQWVLVGEAASRSAAYNICRSWRARLAHEGITVKVRVWQADDRDDIFYAALSAAA